MSWRTCGRVYELIDYDDTQAPWTELRRFTALEISARGVKWSREFERLARGNEFQESERPEDESDEHATEQTGVLRAAQYVTPKL